MKEFIELNVNSDLMIKNVKHVELNISIATVFFEYANFKDNLKEYKLLCCNKRYQHKFDEKLKERFFNTYKLSATTIIDLLYCCEKMFMLMNI